LLVRLPQQLLGEQGHLIDKFAARWPTPFSASHQQRFVERKIEIYRIPERKNYKNYKN